MNWRNTVKKLFVSCIQVCVADGFVVSIFQLNTSLVFDESSLKHFLPLSIVVLVQHPGIFRVGNRFFINILISFLGLEEIEVLGVDIKCFLPSIIDLLLVSHLLLSLDFLWVKVRELLLRSKWLLEFLIWLIELWIRLLFPIFRSKILISQNFALNALRGVFFSLLSLSILFVFQFGEPLILQLLDTAVNLLRCSKEWHLRSLGWVILACIWNNVS